MTSNMNSRFSQAVARELGSAGWVPGRKSSDLVDGWERLLCAQGRFRISAAARRALEEFGGLTIPARDPGECNRPLCLDPTVSEGEEDDYAWYETALAETLFPLGDTPYANVSIAPDGKVYLLASGQVFLAGTTIEEAVENLLSDRTMPEVEIRRDWED